MTALDTLNLPSLEAALGRAAGLLNGIYLPEATPASVAVAMVAVPIVLATAWLAGRWAARPRQDADLARRLDEISLRLQSTELLLADATSEANQLRQRVDQLTSRQESITAGNSRNGLRQAIALSKHGATTRQLIDTCGLSQGEAHLIQTLYGRHPGDCQPDELH